MVVQLKIIYELFLITKRTVTTTPGNCQNARNVNYMGMFHKAVPLLPQSCHKKSSSGTVIFPFKNKFIFKF
jgi:hypothetical protein